MNTSITQPNRTVLIFSHPCSNSNTSCLSLQPLKTHQSAQKIAEAIANKCNSRLTCILSLSEFHACHFPLYD